MPGISAVKAVVGGQTYNLTLNTASGLYEAVITAPSTSSYNQSGHYYAVDITAQDTAGNATTVTTSDAAVGGSLKLVVKEKVPPTVTIQSPAASAVLTGSKPEIKVQVTDNDSGVDTGSFSLQIDGGAAVGWSAGTAQAVSGGYLWTYTPAAALSDGGHTITAGVRDFDGNQSAEASVSVTVDTTPPALDVTAPAAGLVTNQTAGTVAGVTSDALSNPITVTITLNGTDQGEVALGAGGSFSHPVTYKEGSNSLVITATDAAGKVTTITRTVTVNTVAPKITAVTLSPNPVDAGATYTIQVTVE